MFWLIKQILIALLSFSGSLKTKRISLNNKPFIVRPSINDLNPVELDHYSIMLSLDKCSRSYNALEDINLKCCLKDFLNKI